MHTKTRRHFRGDVPSANAAAPGASWQRWGRVKNRSVIVALAALVGVCAAAGSLQSLRAETSYLKRDALHRALDDAAVYQSAAQGARWTQQWSEKQIVQLDEALLELAREKRTARFALLDLLQTEEDIKRHGIALGDTEGIRALLTREQETIRSFVRSFSIDDMARSGDLAILEQALHASLGERVANDLRQNAWVRARGRILRMALSAQDLPERIAEARTTYEGLVAEYNNTLQRRDRAEESLHASIAQQEEIQRIESEVHEQIIALQSELARIDARIQRRVERELIEKGLRSPQIGAHSDGEVMGSKALLDWPVRGRVSAGYLDSSYFTHFGVPHHGMDIVVPQGTLVAAAADGVVFLARDGGQFGYSYILIGHRGGTATLYGHLSSFAVATGDDVRKGQIIGASGATPGTHGAGPMTTGAHLHFEVIQNGEHVDPKMVLP